MHDFNLTSLNERWQMIFQTWLVVYMNQFTTILHAFKIPTIRLFQLVDSLMTVFQMTIYLYFLLQNVSLSFLAAPSYLRTISKFRGNFVSNTFSPGQPTLQRDISPGDFSSLFWKGKILFCLDWSTAVGVCVSAWHQRRQVPVEHGLRIVLTYASW